MDSKAGVTSRGLSKLRPKCGKFLGDYGAAEMVRRQGLHAPTQKKPVTRVEQALGNVAKGVEVILLVDLNVMIQEPCDTWEE